MIFSIVIAAVGLVLLAVTLLLRRRMARAWIVSTVLAAVLLIAAGGALVWNNWQQNRDANTKVYLALRYLEQGQLEEAAYYLKQVQGSGFFEVGAKAVLETMRSNDLIAQIKIDSLESMQMSDKQKTVLNQLSAMSAQDSESTAAALSALLKQAPLSKEACKAADRQFVLESGLYLEGEGGESVSYDPQLLDDPAQIRARVNRDLSMQNYQGAVMQAADLVDRYSSAENRLLLAEAIAQSAYGGVVLTGSEFQGEAMKEDAMETAEKEREKLQEQIDALQEEIDALQASQNGASSTNAAREMAQQETELYEKQQKLQNQRDFLFVYRAFNSIADIHSLQADITRARLYYAMYEYQDAMDCLKDASGSLQARITPNKELRQALSILNRTFSADEKLVGTDSVEFRDAMSTALSGSIDDMVSVSSSQLTTDFVTYIISEQKTYGKDLYASGVDLSQFPQVTVTVSGREQAIQNLTDHKDAVVRDTRQDVEYEVIPVDDSEGTGNICCVVDQSGSMAGEPMDNLKKALEEFVNSMDQGARISLVGFEDSGYILSELGASKAATLAAVQDLYASGGTNIGAGIETAVEAMQSAGASTVLLMTDGQSEINEEVLQEASDAGLTIHTIGFGDVNDELLQHIADETGGQYIRADSASELPNVYRSLVGLIGNTIQIRYTVQDADMEKPRYFFASTHKGNVSLRLDYVLEEPGWNGPQLYRVYPSGEDVEALTAMQEDGLDLTVQLYGTHLNDVTEVKIDGQKAEIDEDRQAEMMYVTVSPQMEPGWKTVEFVCEDGSSVSFENMFCVTSQKLDDGQFRLGNLYIEAYGFNSLLPDGTLVLSDSVRVKDAAPDSEKPATMDLFIEGAVWLQVDAEAVRQQLENSDVKVVDLGDSGVLQCSGEASLGYDDAARWNTMPQYVVRGSFSLDCTADESHLVCG